MITAQQAREKADEKYQNGLKREMEKVESAINRAVDNGEFYAYYNDPLSKPTKEALKKLGYRIESGCQYNDPYYTIEW